MWGFGVGGIFCTARLNYFSADYNSNFPLSRGDDPRNIKFDYANCNDRIASACGSKLPKRISTAAETETKMIYFYC